MVTPTIPNTMCTGYYGDICCNFHPPIGSVQEFRSSGVREFGSSGVQEFRCSGVQMFWSLGVQELRCLGV